MQGKNKIKQKAGTILYREYSYSWLCEVSPPVLGNGFPARFCADLWGVWVLHKAVRTLWGGGEDRVSPRSVPGRDGDGSDPARAGGPSRRPQLAVPQGPPRRPAVPPASAALQGPSPVLRRLSHHGCALAAPLPARPERPLRASPSALRPVSAGPAWGAGSRGRGVPEMGCGCGELRPSRGRATRPGPSLRNLELPVAARTRGVTTPLPTTSLRAPKGKAPAECPARRPTGCPGDWLPQLCPKRRRSQVGRTATE